jgi:outer membrane protein OmpA-like peptidoglycan-associated protein
MNRRFALVVIAAAAALAGCGDDAKPAAKTPANAAGTNNPTPAADTSTTPRPVTPETVPNTPTAAGINIDDKIRKACGIPDSEAHFAFDSARLRPSDTSVLDKVAVCFTTGPLAGKGMRLVGHADNVGPASYNRELGLSRADSVKRYLTSKGVSTVDSTSRGSDDATGNDDAGRAKDRRVDVLLSD